MQRGRRFAKSSSPYADVARRQALALAAATLCIRGCRPDLGQIRCEPGKADRTEAKGKRARILKRVRNDATRHRRAQRQVDAIRNERSSPDKKHLSSRIDAAHSCSEGVERLACCFWYGVCLAMQVHNACASPSAAELEAVRNTVATWLILPVVICLSQRLSHACLCLNNLNVKLRMAHYNSDHLLDFHTHYMDNRSNSRANTCAKSRLSRGGMYLLDKKPMRGQLRSFR